MNSDELSFFKARIGIEEFDRKDMLHIPFDKRELIKTQRFSIPGTPCLYLGVTSYVCWLEMNKPVDSEFNVSSYKIPKKLKILNLTVNESLINGISSMMDNHNNKSKKILMDMIEIFPLVIATSYNIKDNFRHFKSEYIVSQLIMQSLSNFGIDGIAYHSKKVEKVLDAYMTSVNLAIPIKNIRKNEFNNEKEKYGEICKQIKLTKPVNFAEYQKIDINYSCTANKSFINRNFSYAPNGKVKLAGKNFYYDQSIFSKFDDFLVCSEHEEPKIN